MTSLVVGILGKCPFHGYAAQPHPVLEVDILFNTKSAHPAISTFYPWRTVPFIQFVLWIGCTNADITVCGKSSFLGVLFVTKL